MTAIHKDIQVLIVGAGPTGLALALWLAKLGIRFRIIDKAATPGTTTRAVVVHARTLEFYRQLGIADQMVSGGNLVTGINLWTCGKKAMRISIGRIGEGLSPFPYLLDFPQDLHEELLIKTLDTVGVKVEWQTALIDFKQGTDSIQAVLQLPNHTQEIMNVNYLMGCDGAHSTVRQGLQVNFPGGTYEGVFYVADVDANGPPIDHEIHIDLDESDFIGVFPFQSENRVRLIGTVNPAQCRQDKIIFNDVQGRAIAHMKIQVTRVNWFSTYHVHHRVADCFQKGRAFLLGDAAHIHSPVGGQGMNTGIGDAVNLAWKIAAVLNNKSKEDLLHTYEIERMAFARRLVATTDKAFTLVTKQGLFAQWIRTRLLPRILPRLFQMSFIRRLAFRTVSQIGIHYRKSPLSIGTAGKIRGGDRLPWIEIAPQQDNFMPLMSLDWQVHVYGEPTQELVKVCEELALPLHTFSWQAKMQEAGILRASIYLIRPDGYVALADSSGNSVHLRHYWSLYKSSHTAALD